MDEEKGPDMWVAFIIGVFGLLGFFFMAGVAAGGSGAIP